MRLFILASALCALAGLAASSGPATAAKTKMGCERGKEVWNATADKCEPGASKYKLAAAAGKVVAKPPGKKQPPKTPNKK